MVDRLLISGQAQAIAVTNHDKSSYLRTVSYTHLDVYKRQAGGCRTHDDHHAGLEKMQRIHQAHMFTNGGSHDLPSISRKGRLSRSSKDAVYLIDAEWLKRRWHP